MSEELKKTRNALKKERHSRQYRRDEEKRIIISMNVKNDNDFLSVFSQNSTPIISNNVAEFIENSAMNISPSEKLTLEICSRCIDDKEKTDYKAAIREYFTEKYIANQYEIKRNTLIAVLLSLAGLVILASGFCVKNAMWAELVDIIAWVFLWEAVDITFFRNKSLRVKQRRYLSYITMNVIYTNKKG